MPAEKLTERANKCVDFCIFLEKVCDYELHSIETYVRMAEPSLDDLPTELIDRIFDYCDMRTILLSLRLVCKRLYATSNGYNRFTLIYDPSSTNYSEVIFRRIELEKIVSLTISSDHMRSDGLSSFATIFDIGQFTRLRSLTLDLFDSTRLDDFLRRVPSDSLAALSIRGMRQEALAILPRIATNWHHLRKLILNDTAFTDHNFTWPLNWKLEQLTIGTCVLSQYITILEQLPCLRILVMKDCNIDDDHRVRVTSIHRQGHISSLKSLSITDYSTRLEKLELLLSQTPNLTHLKLVCNGQRFDSAEDLSLLERAIKNTLPLLRKFQFNVSYLRFFNWRGDFIGSLKSLIVPFRTPFWLEEKKWYVTVDYLIHVGIIRIYTTPVDDVDGTQLLSIRSLLANLDFMTFRTLAAAIIWPSIHMNLLPFERPDEWRVADPRFSLSGETIMFLQNLARCEISSTNSSCRLTRRPIDTVADDSADEVCTEVFFNGKMELILVPY